MTGVSALIGDVHRLERWPGFVALVAASAWLGLAAWRRRPALLPGGSTRGEDGS